MSKQTRSKRKQRLEQGEQRRPLLDRHNMESVRAGFRAVFAKRAGTQQEADLAFERIVQPGLVLEQLHNLANGVLDNDGRSVAKFRSGLRDLAGRFPGFRGSIKTMRSRIGYKPRPEPIGGIPCSIIGPIGLGPVYLAVTSVFGVGTDEFDGAIDVVAGLSLQHGHLEVASAAMVHGGLDALDNEIAWGFTTRHHAYGARPPQGFGEPFPALGSGSGVDGPGKGLVGFTPSPDGPFPPPFPEGPPGWPGRPVPPRPDDCELAREICEVLLVDAIESSAGPPPPEPSRIAWSDNIDRIEMLGVCAGSRIILHGVGFGDPQPPEIDIVLRVDEECRRVVADSWTDTRIELTLPNGVNSGNVGFFDQGYIDAYNRWVTRFNDRWDAMAEATHCLGISMPTMRRLPPLGNPCAPASGVNAIVAGLPVINSFTANFIQEAVVDPDEDIILRWNVETADDIKLERTTAIGPDFGGNASAMNPSGASWNLGPANHTTPSEFGFRLSASNTCGTVTADVRVNGSKRPALVIDSIEVTQGIQTTTNSVRLVENKPTVVRVSASHGLAGFDTNTVPNLTGRLRIRQQDRLWSPWYDPINGTGSPPTPTPGASITLPAVIDRTLTNDTLNFLLPSSRCTGEVTFQVELRVTGFGAVDGLPGFDETVTRVFASSPVNASDPMNSPGHFRFYRRKRLDIRYIRVRWNGTTPTHQQCRDTIRLSLQRIPTPGATITALAGVGLQTPSTPHNKDRMQDILDDFDDRHNCSIWEALTEWLGSDCPDDDGAYWAVMPGSFYFGKAADIPANTYATPVNTATNTGWSAFGLETKAAHELSHCLDQRHLEQCGAPDGDDPDDWPNQGQIQDVPYDIANNQTVVDAANGVWDLMTYCTTRWTMIRRWRRLHDKVGE